QTDEPNLSGTTIVEVPKELPKVSMVNSCLKKLKFYLASFDMVVKERITATDITEGTWGFEHTKACFRDDIIPFVKNLKELFTSFDQCLIDEVTCNAPLRKEYVRDHEIGTYGMATDCCIMKENIHTKRTEIRTWNNSREKGKMERKDYSVFT
nr:hypothetical protein [Tanacetum cinerariifolium]